MKRPAHPLLTALMLIVLLLPAACSDDSDGSDGANASQDAGDTTDASTTEDTGAPQDTGDTPDASDETGNSPDTSTADAPTADTTPDASEAAQEALARYNAPGPHPVGVTTITLTDAARDRPLTVTIWYPADEAARAEATAGFPTPELVLDPDERQAYADLLADAPADCPTAQTGSARDAALSSAEATWPVAVFSHCFQCLRFSSFTVAEHLASHGVVVAAPNHTGDTLFDALAGAESLLGDEFLQVRAADLRFVLDVMLGDVPGAPEQLAGSLDPDRVGVLGHSFGAVTTGRVLQLDPRPKAGLALAAPMENPLFPSVALAEINKPILLMVAREDNSITEFGNSLMRQNFMNANTPAWKIEVDDAGHWSFSDICALTDAFDPGCGDDDRQTNGEAFTYISVAKGLQIARTYAAAFFAGHLRGDGDALDALSISLEPGIEAQARP